MYSEFRNKTKSAGPHSLTRYHIELLQILNLRLGLRQNERFSPCPNKFALACNFVWDYS